MDYVGMTATILSHIVAGLYLQRQKYNKLVTGCLWGMYAIISLCIMLFQENVQVGFFGMLIMQAVVCYITTVGTIGEKALLFLTYSNSFCMCLGANLILSALFGDSPYLKVCTMGIMILMHIFLYKILIPSYEKARIFFSNGWWKLNVILVFFFIQFLNQYAFNIIDKNSAGGLAFDFIIFSIIFYAVLILIFDSVKDVAEMNKKAFENDELKNVAYIDALTKLKNRAAYMKCARRQVLNYRNNKEVYSILVMLDIDGFKNINDTKGHAEGDEVLKFVGSAIAKHFDDLECEKFRIGGDEFVLLLKDMELSYVEKLIEEMNEELSGLKNVALSYGCSKVNFSDERPFDKALKQADAIMYVNKQEKKMHV